MRIKDIETISMMFQKINGMEVPYDFHTMKMQLTEIREMKEEIFEIMGEVESEDEAALITLAMELMESRVKLIATQIPSTTLKKKSKITQIH